MHQSLENLTSMYPHLAIATKYPVTELERLRSLHLSRGNTVTACLFGRIIESKIQQAA